MFSSILEELQRRGKSIRDARRLRTGIIGGAATTKRLYQDVRQALCLPEITIAYG